MSTSRKNNSDENQPVTAPIRIPIYNKRGRETVNGDGESKSVLTICHQFTQMMQDAGYARHESLACIEQIINELNNDDASKYQDLDSFLTRIDKELTLASAAFIHAAIFFDFNLPAEIINKFLLSNVEEKNDKTFTNFIACLATDFNLVVENQENQAIWLNNLLHTFIKLPPAEGVDHFLNEIQSEYQSYAESLGYNSVYLSVLRILVRRNFCLETAQLERENRLKAKQKQFKDEVEKVLRDYKFSNKSIAELLPEISTDLALAVIKQPMNLIILKKLTRQEEKKTYVLKIIRPESVSLSLKKRVLLCPASYHEKLTSTFTATMSQIDICRFRIDSNHDENDVFRIIRSVIGPFSPSVEIVDVYRSIEAEFRERFICEYTLLTFQASKINSILHTVEPAIVTAWLTDHIDINNENSNLILLELLYHSQSYQLQMQLKETYMDYILCHGNQYVVDLLLLARSRWYENSFNGLLKLFDINIIYQVLTNSAFNFNHYDEKLCAELLKVVIDKVNPNNELTFTNIRLIFSENELKKIPAHNDAIESPEHVESKYSKIIHSIFDLLPEIWHATLLRMLFRMFANNDICLLNQLRKDIRIKYISLFYRALLKGVDVTKLLSLAEADDSVYRNCLLANQNVDPDMNDSLVRFISLVCKGKVELKKGQQYIYFIEKEYKKLFLSLRNIDFYHLLIVLYKLKSTSRGMHAQFSESVRCLYNQSLQEIDSPSRLSEFFVYLKNAQPDLYHPLLNSYFEIYIEYTRTAFSRQEVINKIQLPLTIPHVLEIIGIMPADGELDLIAKMISHFSCSELIDLSISCMNMNLRYIAKAVQRIAASTIKSKIVATGVDDNEMIATYLYISTFAPDVLDDETNQFYAEYITLSYRSLLKSLTQNYISLFLNWLSKYRHEKYLECFDWVLKNIDCLSNQSQVGILNHRHFLMTDEIVEKIIHSQLATVLMDGNIHLLWRRTVYKRLSLAQCEYLLKTSSKLKDGVTSCINVDPAFFFLQFSFTDLLRLMSSNEERLNFILSYAKYLSQEELDKIIDGDKYIEINIKSLSQIHGCLTRVNRGLIDSVNEQYLKLLINEIKSPNTSHKIEWDLFPRNMTINDISRLIVAFTDEAACIRFIKSCVVVESSECRYLAVLCKQLGFNHAAACLRLMQDKAPFSGYVDNCTPIEFLSRINELPEKKRFLECILWFNQENDQCQLNATLMIEIIKLLSAENRFFAIMLFMTPSMVDESASFLLQLLEDIDQRMLFKKIFLKNLPLPPGDVNFADLTSIGYLPCAPSRFFQRAVKDSRFNDHKMTDDELALGHDLPDNLPENMRGL